METQCESIDPVMSNFECVLHIKYKEDPTIIVTMICMTDMHGRISFHAPILAGVNLVWAGMVPLYDGIPIMYTETEIEAAESLCIDFKHLPAVQDVDVIYVRRFDDEDSLRIE